MGMCCYQYCLEVAVGVEQQVLRLQVPVDDLTLVQVLEGGTDVGCVEASGGLVELVALAKDGEELAPKREAHEHVQLVSVLVGVRQECVTGRGGAEGE